MVVHELSGAECREVLARTSLGRLACSRDDQPYIVPVFCYFDAHADCLYGFSTLGQKIDWMRGNPKICLELSEIADQFHWTTVIVVGRYEEITDSPDEGEARRRAHELFQQRQEWWLPATSRVASGEPRHTPVIYRIRIVNVTGRSVFRTRV